MLKVGHHQKNNNKMKNITIIAIMFFIFCPCTLLSQEAKKSSVPPQKFNIGDFDYTSENRRDPFEPVYLSKIKNNKTAASLKRGYELEELKLVGILKTDKTKFAMMEDMQGKGIMFKKGDNLNNNLWVADVVDGRVILAYRLKNDIKNINIDIPKK
jgi:Tfp pilus assembly protein PilP